MGWTTLRLASHPSTTPLLVTKTHDLVERVNSLNPASALVVALPSLLRQEYRPVHHSQTNQSLFRVKPEEF